MRLVSQGMMCIRWRASIWTNYGTEWSDMGMLQPIARANMQ